MRLKSNPHAALCAAINHAGFWIVDWYVDQPEAQLDVGPNGILPTLDRPAYVRELQIESRNQGARFHVTLFPPSNPGVYPNPVVSVQRINPGKALTKDDETKNLASMFVAAMTEN